MMLARGLLGLVVALMALAVVADDPGTVLYRVNCGATTLTDPEGNQWVADQAYRHATGKSYSKGTAVIANTNFPALYKSHSYFTTQGLPSYYSFPVDNDVNRVFVKLHFAEIWEPNCVAGKRVFGVSVEGEVLGTSFDVFVSAGACLSATTLEGEVAVNDGVVNIGMTHEVENVMVSGIEIFAVDVTVQEPLLFILPSLTHIDLGYTLINDPKTQQITLKNEGTADLSISSFSLTDSTTYFSLSTLPTFPLTLAPQATHVTTLTYTPTLEGTHQCVFNVVSDSADSPAAVTIVGRGSPTLPLLTVTKDKDNFVAYFKEAAHSCAACVAGHHEDLAITITNTKNDRSVVISSATFSSSAYSLTDASLPHTLAAGASVSFTVSFTADKVGTTTGTLSIVSEQTDHGSPYSVIFSGVGVALPTILPLPISLGQVETSQSKNANLVISNSGSAITLPAPVQLVTSVPAPPETSPFTFLTTPSTTLANGQTTISVKYLPTTVMEHNAKVLVDLGKNAQLVVDVSGIGVINIAPAGNSVYRLNTGGAAFTETTSQLTWSVDTSYNNGGTAVVDNVAIADAGELLALYQSHRVYTLANSQLQEAYHIAIGNGNYILKLYFANTKTATNTAGSVVFDLYAEGVKLLDQFDVIAAAGTHKAYSTEHEVTVSDGALNIALAKGVGSPYISGVEVIISSDLESTEDSVQLGFVSQGSSATATFKLQHKRLPSSASSINSIKFSPVSATQYFSLSFASDTSRTFPGSQATHDIASNAITIPQGTPPGVSETVTVTLAPPASAALGALSGKVDLEGNFGLVTISLIGAVVAEGGAGSAHPYLHVVTDGPSKVVDFDSNGVESVTLDGTGSYTLEDGSTITKWEWRNSNDQVLCTTAICTTSLSVGTHVITQHIWDQHPSSHSPPNTVSLPHTVHVATLADVPGSLLRFYGAATNIDTLPSSATFTELSTGLKRVLPLPNEVVVPFIAQFTGKLTIPAGTATSTYTFSLTGGTSTRLWIDGSLYTGQTALSLAAGSYTIEARFSVPDASSMPIEVLMGKASAPPQEILASQLSHDFSTFPPPINSIQPTSGLASGGTTITLTGLKFTNNVKVKFGNLYLQAGSTYGQPMTFSSDFTSITLVTPPASAADSTQAQNSGSFSVSVAVEDAQGRQGGSVSYEYASSAPLPIKWKAPKTIGSTPNPTSADWGLDGKLFVGSLGGTLNMIEVDENYNQVSSKTIATIKTADNDITGIAVDPLGTASDYWVYVSHADQWANGGQCAGLNVPSRYLGFISRIRIKDGAAFGPLTPIIRELPVSNHDHANNGIQFDNAGDLYIAIGSPTNAGYFSYSAYGCNNCESVCSFGNLPESPLTSGILRAKLSRYDFDGDIRYEKIPGKTDHGYDAHDQRAGDYVRLTATSSANIEVFSHGHRNPYDLVYTTEGEIFATDNGPNSGYGKKTLGPDPNNPGQYLTGPDPYHADELNHAEYGSYHGHPNLNRAYTDPRQSYYKNLGDAHLGHDFTQAIANFPSSTNGIFEYRSATFQNAMRGTLMAQKWKGDTYRIVLTKKSNPGVNDHKYSAQVITTLSGSSKFTAALDVIPGPAGAILGLNYQTNSLQVVEPDDENAEAPNNYISVWDIFPWRATYNSGTTFTIGGANFGTTTTGISVKFGSLAAAVTSVSAKRIVGLVPTADPTMVNAGLLDLTVTFGTTVKTLPKAFRYIAPRAQAPPDYCTRDSWLTGLSKFTESIGETAAGLIGRVIYTVGEGSSKTFGYNIDTDTWVDNLAQRPYKGHHHAAEVYNNKLYLFGGLGSGQGKVQIYNPSTNSWSLGPDFPTPQSCAGESVNSGSWAAGAASTGMINNLVYVCGGIVGSTTVDYCGVYNPQSNTWTSKFCTLSGHGRNHAAGGSDGSKFYIFGGRKGGNFVGNAYDNVEIYNPSTASWTSSIDSPTTVPAMPVRRGGMGRAVWVPKAKKFVIFGGEASSFDANQDGIASGNVFSRVGLYDPNTAVEPYLRWTQGAPMHFPRHGIYPVLDTTSDRIYVAGGGIKAAFSQSNHHSVYCAPIPSDAPNSPLSATLVPASGAGNIGSSTSSLQINFNLVVTKGSGSSSIIVKELTQGVTTTMGLSDSRVSIVGGGKVANINIGTLGVGKRYEVLVGSGYFESNIGGYQKFTGVASGDWVFTTNGVVAPTVSAQLPANNAANVNPASTTSLSLTFTQHVQKGTGNIVIASQNDGTTQTIPVGQSAVTVNNNVVSIAVSLLAGRVYNILVESSAIKGFADKGFAGYTQPTQWKFTTSGGVAPTATTFPVSGSFGICATCTSLTLTFSENVVKQTSGAISVVDEVTGTTQTLNLNSAAVSVSGNIVSLAITAPGEGRRVHIIVPPNSFCTLVNKCFAGLTSTQDWFFITNGGSPPTASVSPAQAATGVPAGGTSLTLTFSEAVSKGTGSIVIKQLKTGLTHTVGITTNLVSVSGSVVTVTVPALVSGSKYVVQVPSTGFSNVLGLFFAGFFGSAWSFTTVGVVPPTATLLLPADEAAGVATSVKPAVTFSEYVKKGSSGSVTLTDHTDSSTQTWAISDFAISVIDNKLEINTALKSGSVYTATISAGAVVTHADQAFAGLSSTQWNWLMVGVSAPSLSSSVPGDGAMDVAPSTTTLSVTFDQNVQKGTGTITVVNDNLGQNAMTIDVTTSAVSVSNAVVTVTLPQALTSGTAYHVLVPATAFQNAAAMSYVGISDATGWNFGTSGGSPATATLVPAVQSTGVDVATSPFVATMTFSQRMTKGTGLVTLTQWKNSVVHTVNVASSSVTVSSSQLVASISLPKLVAGSKYTLEVPSSAFKNALNQAFVGLSGDDWSFVTAGATAPSFTVTPANQAKNIPTTTKAAIAFSENVIAVASGVITITDENDGSTTTYSPTASQVQRSGNTFTLDHTLLYGHLYNIQVSAGAFKSHADINAAAVGAGDWAWAMVGVTPPAIRTQSPAHQSTNAQVDGPIRITFDQFVRLQTGVAKLYDESVGSVEELDITAPGAAAVSGEVLSLNFPELAAGRLYAVVLPATAVDNVAQKFFPGVTRGEWTFATAGGVAPSATLYPAHGTTHVTTGITQITMVFPEYMVAGSGTIVLHERKSGVQTTIAVNSGSVVVDKTNVTIAIPPTASGSVYSVVIPSTAFSNKVGAAFPGFALAQWQFVTVGVASPTAVALPGNGQQSVPLTAKPTLIFSEHVDRGTGQIVLVDDTVGSSQSFDVSSPSSVALAGSVAELQVSLTSGRSYHVEVPNTAFLSFANLPFAGFAAGDWSFHMVGVVAPTVVSLTPSDNAASVAAETATLKLVFDQQVVKGTGDIVLENESTGQRESIDVNSNAVAVVGKTVTITTSPMVGGKLYHVEVPASCIKGYSGKSFAGIATDTAWNFITAGGSPPSAGSSEPPPGATSVPAGLTEVSLVFDEVMDKGSGDVVVVQRKNGITYRIPINSDDVQLESVGPTPQSTPAHARHAALQGVAATRRFRSLATGTSGNKAVITVPALAAGSAVSVSVPSTAFVNKVGAFFPGTQLNFVTTGATAPTVTTNPPNNARNVSINTPVGLTFSEHIFRGAGQILFVNNTDGSVLLVDDDLLDISGPNVRFNVHLVAEASYYISVQASAFVSSAGLPFGGLLGVNAWSFFTGVPPPVFDLCETCTVGRFCGATNCTDCTAGTFSNLTAQTVCQRCARGSFQQLDGQDRCELCHPGSYTNADGQTSCFPCLVGRYSPMDGSTQCVQCPVGRYQPNVGRSLCLDCGPGQFADDEGQGKCQDCPTGTANNASRQATCTDCPAGSFQPKTGQLICSLCAPGFITDTSGQDNCRPCPAGTFANASGMTACVACAPGSAQLQQGASYCPACPTGMYSPTSGQTRCTRCQPGTFNAITNASTCVKCSRGRYQSQFAQNECTPCSPGQFSDQDGAESCQMCQIGTNTSATGSKMCQGCPKGTFQNQPGQPYCTPCAPGQFTAAPGQSLCQACEYGFENPVYGATACRRCTAGTHAPDRGTSQCTKCAPGTYASVDGQRDCALCASGTFAGAAGLSTCAKCPVGLHQSKVGRSHCDGCAAGTFTGVVGQAFCSPCPVGTYTPVANKSQCAVCAVGRHQNQLGQTQCQTCPVGRYASVTGREECELCMRGFFNNAAGASACTACPAGQHNPDRGATQCVECSPGTFSSGGAALCSGCTNGTASPLSGQVGCEGCPSNSKPDFTRTRCDCAPGYYAPNDGTLQCIECPLGADCSEAGTVQGSMVAVEGYWRPSNSTTSFYRCLLRQQCTGAAIGSSSCGGHHTGPLCALCEDNYYSTAGGTCAQCPSKGSSVVYVVFVFLLIALLLYAQLYVVVRSGAHLVDHYIEEELYKAQRRAEAADAEAAMGQIDDDSSDDESSPRWESATPSASGQFKQRSSSQVSLHLQASTSNLNPLRHSSSANGSPVSSLRFAGPTLDDVPADAAPFQRPPAIEYEDRSDPPLDDVDAALEELDRTGVVSIHGPPTPKPIFTNKLKIALTFAQVVTMLGTGLEINWPSHFKSFALWFDITNVDFILVRGSSVECFDSFGYYTRYLMVVLAPVALFVLVAVCYLLPRYFNHCRAASEQARQRSKITFWRMILYVLFLIYPGVSSTVLRLYVCKDIEDSSYLLTDLNEECYTNTWRTYASWSSLLIILYPVGIPLFFFVLLYRNRFELREPRVKAELGFLYAAYRTDVWWWEVLDHVHKLILTSLLAFIPSDVQLPLGMGVAMAYLVGLMLSNPYIRPSDDRLHLLAQAEIFLLLMAGNVVYHHPTSALDELDDVVLSTALILVLLTFVVSFGYCAYLAARRQVHSAVQWMRKSLGGKDVEVKPLGNAAPAMQLKRQTSSFAIVPLSKDPHDQTTASNSSRHTPGEHSDIEMASSVFSSSDRRPHTRSSKPHARVLLPHQSDLVVADRLAPARSVSPSWSRSRSPSSPFSASQTRTPQSPRTPAHQDDTDDMWEPHYRNGRRPVSAAPSQPGLRRPLKPLRRQAVSHSPSVSPVSSPGSPVSSQGGHESPVYQPRPPAHDAPRRTGSWGRALSPPPQQAARMDSVRSSGSLSLSPDTTPVPSRNSSRRGFVAAAEAMMDAPQLDDYGARRERPSRQRRRQLPPL